MIGKVSKDYGSGKIAKSSITLGEKYTPDILSSIAEKGLNNYNKSRNKYIHAQEAKSFHFQF